MHFAIAPTPMQERVKTLGSAILAPPPGTPRRPSHTPLTAVARMGSLLKPLKKLPVVVKPQSAFQPSSERNCTR